MGGRNGLPKRVYIRGGRHYYVVPGTEEWKKLTLVKEGLPAMYRALAALTDQQARVDLMPAVAVRWHTFKVEAGDWSDGMVENMTPIVTEIGKRLCDYTPAEITTPIAADFLRHHLRHPRAYNMRRSVLRQVLSYAALEGLRDGHNPVDDIPQRKMKKRIRIVTAADIAGLKGAFLEARRGGETHCRILDTMMECGQRIGDVLKIKSKHLTDQGIEFDQEKTDAPLLVKWSPKLKTAIYGALEGRDCDPEDFVFVQSTGKPYTYAGVRSAWDRACAKAGVDNLHRHDMRGKAAADTLVKRGLKAAQDLMGHESITQTEDYIKGKLRIVSDAVGGD
jgi:integrase